MLTFNSSQYEMGPEGRCRERKQGGEETLMRAHRASWRQERDTINLWKVCEGTECFLTPLRFKG